MKNTFYSQLSRKGLDGADLTQKECLDILASKEIDLINLVSAAFEVRKAFWGKEVSIHIINNVQNGHCSEDCHYCAQSKSSNALIDAYPMKSDEEIMKEAETAFQSGAFRYCMVFSGKSQGQSRIDHLAKIVSQIKSKYPIEVCVSPGFLTQDEAKTLKKAGLNRLNHNINTSQNHYNKVCTTHSFEKRIETLQAAHDAELDICSGVIIGMGESDEDVVDAMLTLRKLENVKSIPVNFLLPIEGNKLSMPNRLTPEYCLRVLCLYRFLHPKAEIRIAAGREHHLRDLQPLALFPANSLFMDGYLNAKGSSRVKTLQMIKDAGFTIKSEQNLDELIKKEKTVMENDDKDILMKKFQDLHPSLNNL